MSQPAADPGIVIASDNIADARMIMEILQRDHANVSTATDRASGIEDLDRASPAVLVLAFDSLDKAQTHYLGICRHSVTIHLRAHRTILMCSQAQVRQAYDLCRRRLFDDYVLFWPVTHDSYRLPMAVHSCLRELAAASARRGTLRTGLADPLRSFAGLDILLEQGLAQAGEHTDGVERAVSQVGEDVDAALERLAHRFGPGAAPIATQDPGEVQQEIHRIRSENMGQGIRTIAESIVPMKAWVDELDERTRQHRESSRALGEIARQQLPTVLVVDDDPLQRRLIGHILGTQRHRLEFAQDGMEALMIARKVPLDLVLMDVMMPGMDGPETTRHLRTLPDWSRVPIVMMTGKSVGNVVVDCLRAGATDFVVKPLDRNVLLGKVATALQRPPPAAEPTSRPAAGAAIVKVEGQAPRSPR